MKARESGMPEEKIWENFFDADKILEELEVVKDIENLVDLGFGYGTFTIPACRKIKGIVHAYDIEEFAVKGLENKLKLFRIENVFIYNKDFISEGTGLKDEEADFVLLFNILHAEESAGVLSEVHRILKKNGKAGIIHWRYDPSTPRGPSMTIRPEPETLRSMLINAGFNILKYNINLPPYHYGILAQK